MRQRTIWDWRLRLYPLLVILALVWVSFGNNVAARQAGRDLLTAPSREGHAAGPAVAATPCCVCFEGKIVQRFCWKLMDERR